MSLSKSQIDAFFASPVWKEIESRIKRDLSDNESVMEHPDPFHHGIAVGKRRALNMVLSWNGIFLDEATGKSPYGTTKV
jgi:hypothetical protein